MAPLSSWVAMVTVLLLPEAVSGTCKTVNGVHGACKLRLNYFTLAGTHNSGAGAYGLLYWYSGAVAPSCNIRNQDKSITQQLELGIRYFDFDLSYLSSSSGSWWEKGLVLVHCNGVVGCAYSRSLKMALREIDNFMARTPDAVVAIRFKDHPSSARADIRNHLKDEVLSSFTHVQVNPDPNPYLKDAIKSNKRVFVYANGGFAPRSPINELRQVETYFGSSASDTCYTVNDILSALQKDKYNRAGNSYYPVQVDWYTTGYCDGKMFHRLVDINKMVVQKYHRPINLVPIDYAGRGPVKLSDVVKEINEYNVKMF